MLALKLFQTSFHLTTGCKPHLSFCDLLLQAKGHEFFMKSVTPSPPPQDTFLSSQNRSRYSNGRGNRGGSNGGLTPRGGSNGGRG